MSRTERYARRSATDQWELSPLDEEVAAMTGKRRRDDGGMLHSPRTAARRVHCASKAKAEPRMAKRAAHSKAMSAALWGVAAVVAATGAASPMDQQGLLDVRGAERRAALEPWHPLGTIPGGARNCGRDEGVC
eukprot:COSAG01_NODE_795_length_13541_cov_5.530725_1_plen_133_part_00